VEERREETGGERVVATGGESVKGIEHCDIEKL
jgi:hypothetical protein